MHASCVCVYAVFRAFDHLITAKYPFMLEELGAERKKNRTKAALASSPKHAVRAIRMEELARSMGLQRS